MNDYIDRRYVLYSIEDHKKVSNGCSQWTQQISDVVHNQLFEIMQLIPAADVRPVVRGRWDEETTAMWCICSACGEHVDPEIFHMLDPNMLPNFCPNCGADMRKE